MVYLKFSKSCLLCPYIDVVNNISKMYEDSSPYSASGEISCVHREVCKRYDFNSEVMKVLSKEWILKYE